MKPVSDDYIPTSRATDTYEIAIPASMNEQVLDNKVKEHVGKVLFEREFTCPVDPNKINILRFEALSHRGEVYLNGKLVNSTNVGFLPFDCEVELQAKNRISVVIDNRLTYQTLPVGEYDAAKNKQTISFDFYNYTGIHRSVLIWRVAKEYIKDITVETLVNDNPEKVRVLVDGVQGARITITDEDGQVVVDKAAAGEVITIKNPKLWNVLDAHLYTAKVETELDEYEISFGIRRIEVTEKAFLINGKPVYFKGFGRHEDFYISGKGKNLPVLMRDMNLMHWLNTNSFRTSHYPYGHEIYDYADRHGLLVIDEVPAVTMNWLGGDEFSPNKVNGETLVLHKDCIRRLIERDKNHPSVIMLSVANEPNSRLKEARDYFTEIASYCRTITKLPLTLVQSEGTTELCADLFDVICIIKYYGWYYPVHGDLDTIEELLYEEFNKWFDKYHKPIILSEFGADTLEGLHALPPVSFSEEFQQEYVASCCRAADRVDFCIGEHVWAFADFKTKQGLTRVNGNRKGVFTRDRQPKMVAHFLRDRWAKKQAK